MSASLLLNGVYGRGRGGLSPSLVAWKRGECESAPWRAFLFVAQSFYKLAQHAIVLAALLLAFTPAPCRADWVSNQVGGLPLDAIIGGRDYANTVIYLCRATIVPGSVQPGWTQRGDPNCHVSYAGLDRAKTVFDYWIPSWRPVSQAVNPISFGVEVLSGGVQLQRYPCYAVYDGNRTPGKYGPDYGACYFPFGGIEHHQTGNGFNVLDDPDCCTPALNLVTYGSSPPLFSASTNPYPAPSTGPFAIVSGSAGGVPYDAIVGGVDLDGETLYLCAAQFMNGIHPGKVSRGIGSCSFSWGGTEHFLYNYSVLRPLWTLETSNNLTYGMYGGEYNGNILTNPIVAGSDTDGLPLYICQGAINGGLYPGKVGSGPSFTGGCSIAINGAEYYTLSYGLLTNGFLVNPAARLNSPAVP